ncbi:hypothetical protein AWL63_13285 [Sphingomonas panacis]|uniref:DUF883 domain-containing protein n=1 Tax=Sphingomonas panacis TaxID=1560345 RepID=A0A1B3ZBH6_9SPHN|nr:hypothetical protein [Sphingomonas panacis]AOH84792.1 hypothetical protein AWL63_13285 [Sphingomonas panacis]
MTQTDDALTAEVSDATPAKATIRDTIETTLDTAKESANKALVTASEAARETARKTAEGIEANPLSVLVGGVALGVLAGALIPRGDSETRLLKPVGRKITDTARGAVEAAKDAGKAELAGIGLSRAAASDTAGKLVLTVLTALATAGVSAAKSAATKQ